VRHLQDLAQETDDAWVEHRRLRRAQRAGHEHSWGAPSSSCSRSEVFTLVDQHVRPPLITPTEGVGFSPPLPLLDLARVGDRDR
jgi:hypothetical protein